MKLCIGRLFVNRLTVPCYEYFFLELYSFNSVAYSSALFYILVFDKTSVFQISSLYFLFHTKEVIVFIKYKSMVWIMMLKCYLKLFCFLVKRFSPSYWPQEIQQVFSMQVLRDNKQCATCQLHHISLITPGVT